MDDLRAHGDVMVPAGAIDLAVNVHGGTPAPHVRAAVVAALDQAAAYPEHSRAVAAIAARHARDPADVLVTAGAAEAFWLLAAALPWRRAVVVHPQFTEPEAALRAHAHHDPPAHHDPAAHPGLGEARRAVGVAVERVLRRSEDGWALDPSAVPEAADLVMVGNPNNPTGGLDPPDLVAALCRPGRVTVVDESFMDFVPDPGASLAGRADLPGLVVLRSITKLWGLAGLRAGYLLGPAELVRRLAARRQPWPVSNAALAALTVCAGDEPYRMMVARSVATERARLSATLAALEAVTVWGTAANFLLVRVPDGPRLHAGLLDRGIAVRPSTFPGLDRDHLRITVRDAATTAALGAAMRGLIAAGGEHRPVMPAPVAARPAPPPPPSATPSPPPGSRQPAPPPDVPCGPTAVNTAATLEGP